MYLMDEIAATALRVGSDNREPILQIFPDLLARMKHAPRYLLDAHVMRASIELGLGRPTVFREAMRHLRVPYSTLWLEWEESSRDKLRQELGETDTDPLKPIPARLGFLIECEPGGRRGIITWAWSASLGMAPNVSPYDVCFDLDAVIPQSTTLVEGLSLANLPRMWSDNPLQYEALMDIWRTAEHRPSAWGKTWLADLTPHQQRYLLSDIYGEYIGIWAILLLLTASRPTVAYSAVSRTKLNKARTRKREAPLLDHTTVTMHISHKLVNGQHHSPLGYARKSPRIHLVRSYLARRGDKHWITNSYLRGKGEGVERHVRVTR